MNSTISHTHFAAYLSGAALGAAVLMTVVAPHLKLDGFGIGQVAAACAGRFTPDQAGALRVQVLDAQARRDWLVRGGSSYAAAKVGMVPDSANLGAVQTADKALKDARARYAAACI